MDKYLLRLDHPDAQHIRLAADDIEARRKILTEFAAEIVLAEDPMISAEGGRVIWSRKVLAG